jgi:hypothetical protein
MGVSSEALGVSSPAWTAESGGGAVPRALSASARKVFLVWTAAFWGGVGVLGALVFIGLLDFPTSTKLALYGISIWLNGWLLALVWTQYQYFVFPLIFGVWGFQLLREDLRRCDPKEASS